METLINTLQHFPGIAGFWCYKQGEAPNFNHSDNVDGETLKELAMKVSMFFTYADTRDFQMKVVRFTYDRFNTIGFRLADSSLLLVLCEPLANPSLIVNIVKKMQHSST